MCACARVQLYNLPLPSQKFENIVPVVRQLTFWFTASEQLTSLCSKFNLDSYGSIRNYSEKFKLYVLLR